MCERDPVPGHSWLQSGTTARRRSRVSGCRPASVLAIVPIYVTHHSGRDVSRTGCCAPQGTIMRSLVLMVMLLGACQRAPAQSPENAPAPPPLPSTNPPVDNPASGSATASPPTTESPIDNPASGSAAASPPSSEQPTATSKAASAGNVESASKGPGVKPGPVAPRPGTLVGPSGSVPAGPVGPTHVTVAPRTGTSRSNVSGCLAAADLREQAGSKHPVPPVTRGAPKTGPRLVVVTGGIEVSHPVDHGCCLRSKVETKVAGAKVEVVERIVGDPCRCMCHSTIDTTVGLAPGDYEVIVTLVVSGNQSEELRQRVTVGSPRSNSQVR
jgi:hypothetical protein